MTKHLKYSQLNKIINHNIRSHHHQGKQTSYTREKERNISQKLFLRWKFRHLTLIRRNSQTLETSIQRPQTQNSIIGNEKASVNSKPPLIASQAGRIWNQGKHWNNRNRNKGPFLPAGVVFLGAIGVTVGVVGRRPVEIGEGTDTAGTAGGGFWGFLIARSHALDLDWLLVLWCRNWMRERKREWQR